MSKYNGSKPFPWSILAWPLLWVIGWVADRLYKNLELDIVWDDYDEPVPDPLKVLPKKPALVSNGREHG